MRDYRFENGEWSRCMVEWKEEAIPREGKSPLHNSWPEGYEKHSEFVLGSTDLGPYLEVYEKAGAGDGFCAVVMGRLVVCPLLPDLLALVNQYLPLLRDYQAQICREDLACHVEHIRDGSPERYCELCQLSRERAREVER